MLSVPEITNLAQQCVPNVAAGTLVSVASAESSLDPFVIHVNRGGRTFHPHSKVEAVQLAKSLHASRLNFDMGLGQVNVANMGWLGLTFERAFDGCANLAAAGRVLTRNYTAATRFTSEPQKALRVAFSLYNTGNSDRGFRNGYVSRIEREAARVVPLVEATPPVPSVPGTLASIVSENRPATVERAKPEPATWDVFGRATSSQLIVFGSGARVEQGAMEKGQ